jgi:hypothetical protein
VARRRKKPARPGDAAADLEKVGGDRLDFGDLSLEGQAADSSEALEKQLTGLQDSWRQKRAYEQAIFMQNVDSEYWFCVCFPSREQKDEFLRKAGLEPIGDKYLDGMEVADKLGINIEAPVLPANRTKPPSKRWLKHVRK